MLTGNIITNKNYGAGNSTGIFALLPQHWFLTDLLPKAERG